ncbi:MAG: hypothetical protein ABIN99_15250 [Nitrosospira sp.]
MKAEHKVPENIEHNGDKITNISTVGVLKSKVSKALGLDDIVMVIAIDSKKQKHLRINIPTQTLAQHSHERSNEHLPKLEQESPGVWWLTKCDQSGGGDRPHIIKECVHAPNKPPLHDVIDLGPC